MAKPKSVLLNLRMHPEIHSKLMAQARQKRTSASRLLQQAWINTLPEHNQDLLTLLPSEARSKESAQRVRERESKKNLALTCQECQREHTHMPNRGPWHDRDCSRWFKWGVSD